MRRFVVIGGVALLFMGSASGTARLGQAQSEPACTMTLVPGTALQTSLTNAPEHSVICLARGTWYGPVLLAKSVTIRGFPPDSAEQLASSIEGSQPGRPTLVVAGEGEITVHLENLNLSAVKDFHGLAIAHGKISVHVRRSVISRGVQGVIIDGASQLNIQETRVINNLAYGVLMLGSAVARLTRAALTGNGFYGLALLGSAQAMLQQSEVRENGSEPICARVEAVCTGILAGAKSQLTLLDAQVRNNADWGVAVFLKKCGLPEDTFTGAVVLERSNLLQGNNQMGNHQGEICLP